MKRTMELDGIGKACLTIGAAVALSLVALAGCQIGDLVRVNVPQAVRLTVPSEPRVSFNEAKVVYDDWRAGVERTAEQFRQELDRKAELVSLLASLTSDGLAAGIPALESLPGGGLLATGLVGLGAWFIRSPGTEARLRKEKEASFNKGLEEGGSLARRSATAPVSEPPTIIGEVPS